MYTNIYCHEVPVLDPDFDLADVFNDLPTPATEEEEAVYQRWVDIDLQRQIDEQDRVFKRRAKEQAHIQASIDKFHYTMGGK